MKSILFHFRHHIGIFYALSVGGGLETIIFPRIGLGIFELSRFNIIPFYAKDLLVDIGAMLLLCHTP